MFYKCSCEGKMRGVQNMQLMSALGSNDREMRFQCQQRTLCFPEIFISLDRII